MKRDTVNRNGGLGLQTIVLDLTKGWMSHQMV